jgi:hypothetical protein
VKSLCTALVAISYILNADLLTPTVLPYLMQALPSQQSLIVSIG